MMSAAVHMLTRGVPTYLETIVVTAGRIIFGSVLWIIFGSVLFLHVDDEQYITSLHVDDEQHITRQAHPCEHFAYIRDSPTLPF